MTSEIFFGFNFLWISIRFFLRRFERKKHADFIMWAIFFSTVDGPQQTADR
jgi:hypothetical protein